MFPLQRVQVGALRFCIAWPNIHTHTCMYILYKTNTKEFMMLLGGGTLVGIKPPLMDRVPLSVI